MPVELPLRLLLTTPFEQYLNKLRLSDTFCYVRRAEVMSVSGRMVDISVVFQIPNRNGSGGDGRMFIDAFNVEIAALQMFSILNQQTLEELRKMGWISAFGEPLTPQLENYATAGSQVQGMMNAVVQQAQAGLQNAQAVQLGTGNLASQQYQQYLYTLPPAGAAVSFTANDLLQPPAWVGKVIQPPTEKPVAREAFSLQPPSRAIEV